MNLIVPTQIVVFIGLRYSILKGRKECIPCIQYGLITAAILAKVCLIFAVIAKG